MSKLIRNAAGLICALGLSILPSQALAADVISNGAFNTDLTGWTTVGIVNGGSCSFVQLSAAQPGLTGGYAAATAGGSSQCGFYQQVTLPAATTNRLTVTLGSVGNAPNSTDIGTLEIRDTSNVVLQTLYSHSGNLGATDPILSRGPYNLDAYAGQTIRVFFFAGHTGGVYQQRIDNVVLDSVAAGPLPVPTLSEWAMIVFGALLAGGAAFCLQRRRFTA